jgi:hypothetical protein
MQEEKWSSAGYMYEESELSYRYEEKIGFHPMDVCQDLSVLLGAKRMKEAEQGSGSSALLSKPSRLQLKITGFFFSLRCFGCSSIICLLQLTILCEL